MPSSSLLRSRVELKVSDGTQMSCYVSRLEAQNPLPGLIVFQEAFGVNGHIRNVTDRLAQEGYVAIAPELFHRTAPGFEGSYTDFGSVMPHMQAMTPEKSEADIKAVFEWLLAQSFVMRDDISSVGFCMGGRISFLANSAVPLRCAASYYGGGIAPALLDRSVRLHAPMLFFWGGLDKHISPELRGAVIGSLKANNKSYTNVEFSGADHGFNCEERSSYNPKAAKQAWALLLEFLRSA